MAEIINMPKLGFDMAEGTLVRWLKKVGETVNKGEVLAEIETDKATVEVESQVAGVVRKLLVDEGAVVPVNSAIAIVGTEDEKIQETAGQTAEASAKKAESELQKAEKGEESNVNPQDALVEEQKPVSSELETFNEQSTKVRASPLAKKIARDQSVELSRIRGSGPGGRIVRRDIEAVIASQALPVVGRIVSGQQLMNNPTIQLSDQSLPLSKLRSAIGRRMAEAKTTIPHFYVTHEYKMNALMDLRAQFNKIVPENEKASVNDFIIKGVGLVLREFPNLNASLHGAEVIRHGQINIGVAVSVEGGLLTVICRDADQKSLRNIAIEMKAMATRAREGKVKPEDIEGSTFSISNLGMYDVENFSAIINPPEAAILAVSSAREAPVVENGAVKPGWRMKATISVDHRVSDGAEAARFMQALALYLEEPVRLIM
jgi:pyruvate dehydrogenase E2 component (dihydrolipoamide acetyltransferase)